MADNKTDRRTIKTRKAIFEALAELLCEKELRKITVNELTGKADIHRVTFYKHFLDIYDVYDQLENMILSDLGLLITEHGVKPTFEVYAAVFQYIKENPKYFKMLFNPHSSTSLYWKVQKMVEGLNHFLWSESFDIDMNDSRVDCVIRYHSNGSLAIIGGWVQSDFAQSEDFVAEMLRGLDKSTQEFLSSLIGSTG